MIDGEAVVLGVDGVSDFNALHSRKCDHEVQLYAFDMLAGDGDDYHKLPLSMRKATWRGCCAVAPKAFSSRRSSRARSVPTCFATPASRGWRGSSRNAATVPIARAIEALGEGENRQHPAFSRVLEQF